MSESPYPEHEKLSAVADRTQAIGEFLDWVGYTHGGLLCHVIDGELVPIPVQTQELLAQWAGIDLEKLDAEKRVMLEVLRAAHEKDPAG